VRFWRKKINREDRKMQSGNNFRTKEDGKMQGDRRSKTPCGFLLFLVSFLSALLIAVDSKAADPAADYPSRPVELIHQGAPGSNTDAPTRLIADIIQQEKLLKQFVVPTGKVGSGGAVAAGYLFERQGNPNMFLLVASGAFLNMPLVEKVPYNYKSFTPICNITTEGAVLAVRSDSPYKTIGDLIADARKRPKDLIQGGGSFTSGEAMQGRSIQKTAGVQWNFLSFAGGTKEALLNVLSGNVQMVFADPTTCLEFVRAGKLRVLVTAAPKRYDNFKDIPTVAEAGLGEIIGTYRGFVGPPNMPAYAVKKLEEVLKKVLDHPRYKKFMDTLMIQPYWMSSTEYGKFLEEESKKAEDRLRELNLLKK
jgi:putative tricarboxylic transport membrane protein